MPAADFVATLIHRAVKFHGFLKFYCAVCKTLWRYARILRQNLNYDSHRAERCFAVWEKGKQMGRAGRRASAQTGEQAS